jgi:hypothetical protein
MNQMELLCLDYFLPLYALTGLEPPSFEEMIRSFEELIRSFEDLPFTINTFGESGRLGFKLFSILLYYKHFYNLHFHLPILMGFYTFSQL